MTSSAAVRRRIAQLVRYATTSVVATTISLLVLTALVGSATMRPAPANVVATLAGVVPSFELNRRWVWDAGGAIVGGPRAEAQPTTH
jgi:putative flippase GtrA